MITDDVYEKMVLMSYGKIPRDQEWLDNQARLGHIQEEAERKAIYAKEHPSPRSQRAIELEAREFDLKIFGRRHMEKYARPLDGDDRLSVPGDAPAVRVLQEHGASPAPHKDANGRLLLQNHAGCGIRQKLILQRG